MPCDVAFLVYRPLKQRRKDNSFDGNDNVGAYVVKDCLERAGMEVGFCSPETAHHYRVVMVSFTSTYDLIAYYQAVALLPPWQPGKRTFAVVGGGFGLQNPTAVRRYIDYAVFGRAEGFAADLVGGIIGGGGYEHPSVMRLPDLHPVVVAQSTGLYPHPVDCAGDEWRETFTGCPRKCRFCHYTWSRRSSHGNYRQEGLTGGASPEVTWDQLLTYPRKAGRVRSAIDGFSERLRHAYGKRISNADIVGGIERLGSFGGKATVVLAYNISNMPGETEDDRRELYATIGQAQPETRVILVLQSTPFRPSLLTPMQHCAVSLDPPTSDLSASVIVDRPNLRAMHSFSNESPWSQLQTVIIERATPETDNIFHAMCFAPRLQSGRWRDKVRLLRRNFDLMPHLRRYELAEKHPAWFLTGYMPQEKTLRVSEWMERQIPPVSGGQV
jgi:hypothetical protein